MSVDSNRKSVVLLNMYEWTEEYPADNPLRDVTHWFARHLPADDGVKMSTVGVADDLLSAARSADGVIISGSPRDAWVHDGVNERAMAVVEHCLDESKPMLGVCYGHQLLGCAIDASVGRQPMGYELGNVEITLTDEGVNCPLFEGLPRASST